MYAIFLLVLLADVARAHASVSAASDAGLILSAASQLQGGSADGAIDSAILALRRSDRSSAQATALDSFGLRLSGWSRNFFDFSRPSSSLLSSSLLRSDGASAIAAGVGLRHQPGSNSASPSRIVFEHTGSPAP